MGGCISSDSSGNSKLELSDINSNIYRVVNVDDNGVALWSGQLGITRTELTLYRKGRDPTRWPLKCLRRYGYDADLFSFEAGRRCTTGEGIYAFRCRRAESLFQTMQNFIQLSSDDGTGTLLLSGGTGNDASVLSANGGLTTPTNMPSNYILPNSRSANQTLRLSPSVCGDESNRNFDVSDANYLEPIVTASSMSRTLSRFHSIGETSLGPLSPGGSVAPHSPGSPNSINNILEVTSLNPLPLSATSNNNGVSNIYQEFPLRAESFNTRDNNAKKLSLDIPPQEQAPPVSLTASNAAANALRAFPAAISNAGSNDVKHNSSAVAYNEAATPVSPVRSLSQQDSFDSMPMYMNVTPGEMSTSVSTPKLHGIINGVDGISRASSTLNNNTIASNNNIKISAFGADPSHCYENLEPSEVRPMLLQQQRAQQQRRLSKTDIMSRLEQVAAASPPPTTNEKTSEPSTPTHRKVNYIVLDLDQNYAQNNSVASNMSSTTSSNAVSCDAQTSSANGSLHTSPSRNSIQPTTSSSTPATSTGPTNSCSATGLLPPESPKKGIFDYATIDFNKTVALSNSTAPSMDCEGSRKTRHSSTITPIGPIFGNGAPPSHSNSISD